MTSPTRRMGRAALALGAALVAVPVSAQQADADAGATPYVAPAHAQVRVDDRDPGGRSEAPSRASVVVDDGDDAALFSAPIAFTAAPTVETLDDGRDGAPGTRIAAFEVMAAPAELLDGRDGLTPTSAARIEREPYDGLLDNGREGGPDAPTPEVADVPEARTSAPDEATAGRTELGVVMPNPTPGSAAVTFQLDAAARALVSVFDVQGRLVRVVHDAQVEPDVRHTVRLDLSDVAAGTYLVVLDVDGERRSQTFQVVR